MTNWPAASAVASATVLPASRSSTFAFGAARPAMTASPEGSTFTTSKAGSRGKAAAWLGALPGAGGLVAAGAAAWTAGGALGALGGLGSAGALATTGGAAAGLGRSSPGWVQTTAPAPAATTTEAAAPTQITVRCDSMLTRLRQTIPLSGDCDKSLTPKAFIDCR